MNIPADAVIATDKLTGYLLVARPLDDKSKFLASAGFTQANYGILEAAIRNLATVAPAEEDHRNVYGISWRAAGQLQGPTGTLQAVRQREPTTQRPILTRLQVGVLVGVLVGAAPRL